MIKSYDSDLEFVLNQLSTCTGLLLILSLKWLAHLEICFKVFLVGVQKDQNCYLFYHGHCDFQSVIRIEMIIKCVVK